MTTFSRRGFLKSVATTCAAASLSRAFGAAAAAPAARSRGASSDVLLIGGGVGGFAAALAAARMGASVILTEETAWLGGQATTQGVPLDEHPWIEQFGCTASYRAFRQGVRAYYRAHYPVSAKARADKFFNPGAGWVSACCFEPRAGVAVLLEMLAPYLTSGRVQLLMQHRPVAVAMEGDRAVAVTVHSDVSGTKRVLTAPYILDATELGELLPLGGIDHVIGAESQRDTGEPNALPGPADPMDQMAPTHVFAMDYCPGEEHVIAKPSRYEYWRDHGGANGRSKLAVNDLFGAKQDYFGRPVRPGHYIACPWNFRRLFCRSNFEPAAFPSDVTVAIWPQNEYHSGVLLGVSAEERRKNMAAARELSLSALYWLQTEAPDPATGRTGFPGLRPRGDIFGTSDALAPYPYIRESCRLKAEFTILEQHFRTDGPETKQGPVKYPDSVGVSGYRIDIHKPAKKGAGSMTESNHGKHWCQQIPLGALIPRRVENVLAAGKNLGVTAVTNGSYRVHPAEWNIGESAGALAAYCVAHHRTPREVRNTPALLSDFQRELVRQGVELDWPNRETSRSYYSHHNLELKDADTFYFGEAERLTRA